MRPGSKEVGSLLQPSASVAASRIVLDLAGTRVDLSAAEAISLRDAAAAEAGSSSAARDLAQLLESALMSPHTLALRRAERQALAAVALHADLRELASRLLAARS